MTTPEIKTIPVRAQFKADSEKRTIEGYASVAEVVDLGGDIVSRGAFAESLSARSLEGGGWRIPLLWQHDWSTPIGKSLVLEEDSTGLFFKDKLSRTQAADEALELVSDGVIDGVSIGYIPEMEEYEEREDGSTIRRLHRVDLFEKSLVTFPMNDEARVTAARKLWIDTASLPLDVQQKIGRVLSASNFSRLEKAIEMLREILESARLETETEAEADDKGATPDESKGVIPYKSFPTDDGEWDGPAEIAAADTDDLLIMATWYDSEDSDVKAAYKLPHHRADGHAVVWSGVTAAMGALLGARGGVDIPDSDRQGVYDHLAKHYTDDFDREPPELRSNEESDDKSSAAVDFCQRGLDSLIALFPRQA